MTGAPKPLKLKDAAEIEYRETVAQFRQNQTLIAQTSTSYFALCVPLMGVVVAAKQFPIEVRVVAMISGLVISLLWFHVSERMRLYNTSYKDRLRKMEGDSEGLFSKDQALVDSKFILRRTPGHSQIRSLTYLAGAMSFALVHLYLSVCEPSQ